MKVIILLLSLLIVTYCEPIEPLDREETRKVDSSYLFVDMKRCNTYEQAMTYKIMCQRYDWTIREMRR